MQTDEPGTNDSNGTAQSNLNGKWPPSIVRLMLAALVTTGLGLVVLKTMYPIFSVPEEIINFPEQSPRWMYERLDKTKSEVDGKNFMLVFGVTGALFGALSVAFAFGPKAIKAIVVGLVAAGGLGVLGAYVSNLMFNNMVLTSGKDLVFMGVTLDSMKQSIVGYALLWGLVGLGVGLGIGISRSLSKAVVAGISGLAGGIVGGMMFVILTAQFSVGTLMNRLLPYGFGTQAVWLALFTLMIAVCIALGTGEKQPKKNVPK